VTPCNPEPGPRKKTPEPPTHNWPGRVHPDEHDTALLEPNVFLGGRRGSGPAPQTSPLIPSGTPPITRKKGSQHRHAPRLTRATHSHWVWKVVNHASLPRKRSPLSKKGVNTKTVAQDENRGRLGRCNGYPIWVYISELRYESKSLVRPSLG